MNVIDEQLYRAIKDACSNSGFPMQKVKNFSWFIAEEIDNKLEDADHHRKLMARRDILIEAATISRKKIADYSKGKKLTGLRWSPMPVGQRKTSLSGQSVTLKMVEAFFDHELSVLQDMKPHKFSRTESKTAAKVAGRFIAKTYKAHFGIKPDTGSNGHPDRDYKTTYDLICDAIRPFFLEQFYISNTLRRDLKAENFLLARVSEKEI